MINLKHRVKMKEHLLKFFVLNNKFLKENLTPGINKIIKVFICDNCSSGCNSEGIICEPSLSELAMKKLSFR
jgi:hypothetical protein